KWAVIDEIRHKAAVDTVADVTVSDDEDHVVPVAAFDDAFQVRSALLERPIMSFVCAVPDRRLAAIAHRAAVAGHAGLIVNRAVVHQLGRARIKLPIVKENVKTEA